MFGTRGVWHRPASDHRKEKNVAAIILEKTDGGLLYILTLEKVGNLSSRTWTIPSSDFVIEEEKSEAWLIWSNEHVAWWAEARNGYTNVVEDAGRYTYKEALEIVRNANHHQNFNGRTEPNEAMILDDGTYPNAKLLAKE